MSAFCVKCKSKTNDVNPRSRVTKNGRNMIQSQCSKCGTIKCQFVSGSSKPKRGKGIGRKIASVLGAFF